jgi:hypothetical protein
MLSSAHIKRLLQILQLCFDLPHLLSLCILNTTGMSQLKMALLSFLTNTHVHGLDTRNKNHLYLPVVSLSCVQKGVSYSGVKIFSSLPSNIQSYRNDRKRFKNKLYRLYVFFWVFPRHQIVICRRFGTLCQFHLQRLGVEYWVLSTLHPAHHNMTPGKYPKEYIQYSKHGKTLKSRSYTDTLSFIPFIRLPNFWNAR